MLAMLCLIVLIICTVAGGEENFAGNLLSGGKFAYKGNTLYIVNPEDSRIYRVKKDSAEAVSEVEYCKNLVIHKNFIYYIGGIEYGKTGIYKTNLRNSETTLLYNGNTPMFDIYDNIIYFISSPTDGSKLSAMRTDGSRRRELSKEDISRFFVDDDTIYYTNEEKHMYKNDLNGRCETELADINADTFFVDKNLIYYTSENSLMRYNLKNSANEKLVEDKVEDFIVCKGKSYYSNENGIFDSASNCIYSGNSDGLYAYDKMLVTFGENSLVKIKIKTKECENIALPKDK